MEKNMVRVIATRKGSAIRQLLVPADNVSVIRADEHVPIHKLPRLRVPGLAGHTVRFMDHADATRWTLHRIGRNLHANNA